MSERQNQKMNNSSHATQTRWKDLSSTMNTVTAQRSLEAKDLLSQHNELINQILFERQENRTLLRQNFRELTSIAQYESFDGSLMDIIRRHDSDMKDLQEDIWKKRHACGAIDRKIRDNEAELDRAQTIVKRYQYLIELDDAGKLPDEKVISKELLLKSDCLKEQENCIQELQNEISSAIKHHNSEYSMTARKRIKIDMQIDDLEKQISEIMEQLWITERECDVRNLHFGHLPLPPKGQMSYSDGNDSERDKAMRSTRERMRLYELKRTNDLKRELEERNERRRVEKEEAFKLLQDEHELQQQQLYFELQRELQLEQEILLVEQNQLKIIEDQYQAELLKEKENELRLIRENELFITEKTRIIREEDKYISEHLVFLESSRNIQQNDQNPLIISPKMLSPRPIRETQRKDYVFKQTVENMHRGLPAKDCLSSSVSSRVSSAHVEVKISKIHHSPRLPRMN